MASLFLETRTSLRHLGRHPIVALTILVSFALGITGTTTVAGFVDETLYRPFPYHAPSELVAIFSAKHAQPGVRAGLSYPDYKDLHDRVRSLTDLAAYQTATLSFGGGDPKRIEGERVSPNLWHTLGVQPIVGSTAAWDVASPSGSTLVLSYVLWQTQFGGRADIIGAAVDVDGRQHRVIAIMPPSVRFPEVAQFWVPLERDAAHASRSQRDVRVIGRLAARATLSSANAEVTAIVKTLAAAHTAADQGWDGAVMPFRQAIVGQGVKPILLLVQTIAALVTLLAAINVAALLLAYGATRRSEFAVRLALGASRQRIARLIIVESLGLSLVGALIAVALSQLALREIRDAIPIELPAWMPLHMDVRIEIWTLFVAAIAGIMSGMLPSSQLSATEPADALRQGGAGTTMTRATRRMRRALTMAQLGLSVILLTLGILLMKSYRNIIATSPGFEPDGVLTTQLAFPAGAPADPAARGAFVDRLLTNAHEMAGVDRAAVVNFLPLSGNSASVTVAGEAQQPTARARVVDQRVITPEYFAALDIPLVSGRAFETGDDAGHPRVVIIDQKLAKLLWPTGSALGRRLHIGAGDDSTNWAAVVGVVAMVRQWTLAEPGTPTLYQPFAQRAVSSFELVIRTRGDPLLMRTSVKQLVRRLDANMPMTAPVRLSDVVERSAWVPKLTGALIVALAAVAAILAIVGVYGMSAEGAKERLPELAIRAAIGARPLDLIWLNVRDSAGVIAVGVVAGAIGTLLLAPALRRAVFGVSPADPWVLLSSAALLSLVAIVACVLPARSAARVDPLLTLRRS